MILLLIDDVSLEHDLFRLALERIKIEAEFFAVTSCEDALTELVGKLPTRPDYIFLDLDMPLVDGYACFKMLRGHDFLKSIPIVLYSSEDRPLAIKQMLKSGARCHLIKSRVFATFCKDLQMILCPEMNLTDV